MNGPILIEPGARVAVPEYASNRVGAPVERWRLGTVYGLRPDVPGVGVLVSVDGAPVVKRQPTDDEDGELLTVADLRPVADVPEVLAELHASNRAGRRCPLGAVELRREALAAAFVWNVNGWDGYAAAAGLDVNAPPAPDGNDRVNVERCTRFRGPFRPYVAELRCVERLFAREYARLRGAS